jgi:hypothetical protein
LNVPGKRQKRRKEKVVAVIEYPKIPSTKGGDDMEYAKVKTNAYMEKLRTVFGTRWMEFWE